MADTDEPVSKRTRRSKAINVSGAPEAAKSCGYDPENSLLRLPNECLKKVVEHLDVESLCYVANVCKRLKQIAEQVFAECHKEFKFEGNPCKNSVLRHVLCKFGHLITSIDAFEAYFDGDDRIDVGAIAKKCSRNLEALELHRAQINCVDVKPMFAHLKHLDLDVCDFIGDANSLFSGCKQLETLYCQGSNSCHSLAKRYPKLEGLTFDCNYPAFLTCFEIMRLNPQLKYLHMMAMAEDMFISPVIHYTKNLERLWIRPGFMASTPEIQTKRGFLQLSKLKKLKWLAIDAGWETYAKLTGPLMDAFAKAKIPLEHLDLRDFQIKSSDIKSISNVKSMEILILDKIVRVTETDLVSLTENLPMLSTLHLYFDSDVKKPLSANGLAKMAKFGKELIYVALVGIQNIKIDQKTFENILKAVKNREDEKKLTIGIHACQSTCSFDVPQNILQASRKQLVIRYKIDDRCECEHCAE